MAKCPDMSIIIAAPDGASAEECIGKAVCSFRRMQHAAESVYLGYTLLHAIDSSRHSAYSSVYSIWHATCARDASKLVNRAGARELSVLPKCAKRDAMCRMRDAECQRREAECRMQVNLMPNGAAHEGHVRLDIEHI